MLIRVQTGLLFCVIKGHQKITSDRTSCAKTNNGYQAFPVVEGSRAISLRGTQFNVHRCLFAFHVYLFSMHTNLGTLVFAFHSLRNAATTDRILSLAFELRKPTPSH